MKDVPASRVEILLFALTLARLGFIPAIVASFLTLPAVTALAVGLFIVVDLFDGILARRLNSDTPLRRSVDSIVDRLTIDTCLIAAGLAGALPLPILFALLVRDAYLALLCGNMVRQRRVAIKADWLYRSLNLCVAAWALAAPFVSSAAAGVLALALLAFSLVVAADLTIQVAKVLAAPSAVRDTVIGAGELRRTEIGGVASLRRPSLTR